MSSRQAKNFTVVNFLATIRNHYGIKNNAELARWLELKRSALSNWEDRGTIPDEGKFAIMRTFPALSPQWVDSLGQAGEIFTEALCDHSKDILYAILHPYLPDADDPQSIINRAIEAVNRSIPNRNTAPHRGRKQHKADNGD